MSLPRYPKYKDSGVAWLGEVPEHWEVKRLKYSFYLLTIKTNRRDYPVALENIESWTGKFISTETEFQGEGIAFEIGDILFGKLRPYLAKAYLAECSGEAVGDFHVMSPVQGINSRFFQYQILSKEFISIVDGSTFGSKMPRASWEFVGGMAILNPPLAEQTAIAEFLDRETAKIDELVAAQRRLIELLKEKRQAVISHAVTRGLNPQAPLKPSGIEWLGDVPSHWDLVPIYMRYEAILGKMLDEKKITGNYLVPYLRNVDVQWDSINIEDLPQMDIEPNSFTRFTLKKGDILICEGGEVGRTAIWNDELSLCAFQKAIHRLRPLSSNEDPRFLFYCMRFAAATDVFLANGNPNTIPHLTGEKLRAYRFPTPPFTEQKAIVAYLDIETAKFDTLTAEAQRAIDLLQERRSALISAAVTGQIDIRGVVSAPLVA